MTTSTRERSRTEAVQSLFDGLQRLSRALRSRSGDWAAVGHEVSRGDLFTLGVVARQGSIRSGQVAQALGVDPSVVSRQVAALERLGLVARSVDPADRRAELVSATDLGHERLREARAAMCDSLAERLDLWDPDAIADAAAVVQNLAGLLQSSPGADARAPYDQHTTPTEDSKDAHA